MLFGKLFFRYSTNSKSDEITLYLTHTGGSPSALPQVLKSPGAVKLSYIPKYRQTTDNPPENVGLSVVLFFYLS